MQQITFDQAIELLEITDISKISIEDIPKIEKKTKKRWHPDNVSHLNDDAITKEYNTKFQQIEIACQMIYSFLKGTYHAGEAFTQTRKTAYEEPEEIIRKNAPDIQQTLKNLWNIIRERRYKWSEKEITLSDGFKLKELLSEDFKEDIAMLSVVSFFYGLISLGLLTAIASMISPAFGTIVAIICLVQSLSCVIGFLPLSRFWLPQSIQTIVFKFIDFGLGVYNWAEQRGQNSTSPWLLLLVRIPVLFAKLIKYVILLPLYEITKALVNEKVVGVVKSKVNYYAEAAEWYIEDLMNAIPNEMTSQELLHLSYLYTELSNVKANTNESDKYTSNEYAYANNSTDGSNDDDAVIVTQMAVVPLTSNEDKLRWNKKYITYGLLGIISIAIGVISWTFYNKSSKEEDILNKINTEQQINSQPPEQENVSNSSQMQGEPVEIQSGSPSSGGSPENDINNTNGANGEVARYEWVTCTECNGRGSIDEYCDVCKGVGKYDCGSCNGKGFDNCSNCNATGYIIIDGVKTECFQCNGKGNKICPYCNGNRKVVCSRCFGNKIVSTDRCSLCDGEGKIQKQISN